jgi:hypothetical protein
MRPDIELARQRLQTILCELEQCCAEEEAFSPRLVREAHTLVRLLHEEGYNMATIMRIMRFLWKSSRCQWKDSLPDSPEYLRQTGV